jgi:hypothetical protein
MIAGWGGDEFLRAGAVASRGATQTSPSIGAAS